MTVSRAPDAPLPGPALLARVRSAGLAHYDAHRRDLPWRRLRDPYATWVSEVMLQQTQVAVVIPYFEAFLRRFPDVATLAAAPLDDVLAGWRGLGYYARARNLHRAAQAIVERHGGRLPADADALAELPGFGRYTVGAVASIAFGLAVPLVDGNVARLLSRVFVVEGIPGTPERERRLWALARALVDGERPGDWNQALMELGATVCRPEQPTCLLCPLREDCGALREGRVETLPPPKPRPVRRRLHLAVAAARRGDAVLLVRTAGDGLFGGLWALPSVECEPGAEVEALRARWPEVGPVTPLATVTRELTHRALTLAVYAVEGPVGDGEARWVTAAEAQALGVSAAMQAVLARVFSPPAERDTRRRRR